jgi:hypothetical protein
LFRKLEYRDVIQARHLPYTVDIDLLKAWMGFCEKSHRHCNLAMSDPDQRMKIRLIDIHDRCLVDSSLSERYVALSYVWGKGRNEVLTTITAEHFKCRGSLTTQAIPRIISDAMDLVAAIGERYLWADTACIIQNDASDKQRQLPIMGSIYTHPILTVIAAVDSANDSLPRWDGCHHRIPYRDESLNGVLYTTGRPNLATALRSTTWSERGWTFQEGILARRSLIFTHDQIY